MNCSTCTGKIFCKKKPDTYKIGNIIYPSCTICYATHYGVEYSRLKEQERQFKIAEKYKNRTIDDSILIRCFSCNSLLDYIDIEASIIDSKDIYCEECYASKKL
jgi:Early Protein (E6)